MTRRILFTSQKGGVGKSTLARATAIALAGSGRRVLLADFDGDQQTLIRWNIQRRARALEPAVDADIFAKPRKLKAAAKGYDDVVIDTRGQHDDPSIELARLADVVFLPSSFSQDDIVPTLRVIGSLRRAGVPADHIAVVFCRTGGSARQEQQARSVLDMNKITALQPVLPQKDGFVNCYATGRTGAEAANKFLREAATAVDDAIIAFIDAATEETAAEPI